MINTLAIITNKFILERMIKKNEDYNKILKQSQKLDIYINEAMKKKTKERRQNT